MNCDCCAADLKGLAAYDDPETGKVSALTLFPRGFDQVIPQVLAVFLF